MIDRFQGMPGPNDETGSEEWVASTTYARPSQTKEAVENAPSKLETTYDNQQADSTAGFSHIILPDHHIVTLKDVLDLAPKLMLGEEHTRKFGKSMGLLVKILDTSDPIPIHVHPPSEFAKKYLNSVYGKTESWIVLGTRPTSSGAPTSVWLGFKKDMVRDNLHHWVAEQNSEAMYNSLHRVELAKDDVLFVPAGLPHALGSGLFVLEPQEPTDFSLTLEYWRYNLDPDRVALGLDWERALDCLDYKGYTRDALLARCRCVPKIIRQEVGGCVYNLLRPEATQFFGTQRIVVSQHLVFVPQAHFAVDLIVGGQGLLIGTFGQVRVARGTAVFLPASMDTYRYQTESEEFLELIRCLPPMS